MALAGQMLQAHSPEQVAAALIRLYRASLPAPEELFTGHGRGGHAAPGGRAR